MGNIVTTVAALSGGVSGVSGVAKRYRAEYGGTWSTNDLLQMIATDTLTAQADVAGFGLVTGLQPTFAFTFNEKLNFLAGSAWYFSAVGDATDFNNKNSLGNGFVQLANISGTAEDLVAMASYQGGVAVISRRNTQIWSVDPEANNYQKRQILENIGTIAKLSVKPVGDMDVYLLADNGVRSVRVRDASNNAIISDIGVPIDEIIAGVLQGLTEEQQAAACAIVEPSSNRYWLYLPGNYIYVFSYFPGSGIGAWSRYRAVYDLPAQEVAYINIGSTNEYTLIAGRTYFWLRMPGSQTMTCGSTVLRDSGYFVAETTAAVVAYNTVPTGDAIYDVTAATFTPEKFVVQNGRVYARAGNNIFLYGGLNNQTYDQCFPQWDIPFLNAKSPATRKLYNGLDAICEGTWTVNLGTNVANADDLATIYTNSGPSLMRGKALAGKQGTHFKLRGIETGAGYARFSSAILHYEGGDNK